jgi:hypothetical protein
MNKERHCGATNEVAPGTSNAVGRSRSTKQVAEQVRPSSGGVEDQEDIMSEIIHERETLGAKHGGVRFIRVKISDQKMLFRRRLDYRGNQRVLR